ncbi:uncharacterized protein FA14DRAFT_160957 [Meira miltonrushii]|uniref:Uncharacterized protein n=1 Tax=Meira miltonrushii TaxID=1280837 RepID=A0A316VFH3_9BASI|nr:uncharacterized protein FA14DRAFT_160957 [Meira miltonrushii]PWN36064.1 hypothetical protein FA14DRAFT_160957 [Meira miltonrushii]
MTTLADELDLDPAFNDLSMSQGQRGVGMPMSMDMEEEEEDGYDDRASSSVESSPARTRRRAPFARRGRAAAMGGNVSSDEEDNRASLNNDAGFSLADELGGHRQRTNGVSLADEVNDSNSNDEDPRHPTSTDSIDDEARARKDQEHYLVSSEILGDSIRQTDAFLHKLRKVADTGTTTANTTLPSSTSSNSITSGVAGIDDTASIEKTAAGIVRQLRDHTQLREGQVRELQEYDRILRRAFEEGGEYLIALAESEEISENPGAEVTILPEERDPLGVTAAAAASINRRNHPRDDSIMSDDGDDSALTAVSPSQTFADLSLADDTAKGRVPTTFQNLIGLQQSTSDLIVSLGAIHEHSQIAHASMGDAQRRIRNIRTVLTNWQQEIRSIEQSQSWIASWESGNLSNDAAHKRPDDIREWTQGHLDKFQRTLDEAHNRAQELLKPVKDPVLDRLAATKA